MAPEHVIDGKTLYKEMSENIHILFFRFAFAAMEVV